ncbi:MAG: hypothetical protein HN380_13160 [Victivallales bacterium]|jgi:hypothetical protein|nr:hypothetical protein [Victivallales bacterium]
MQHRPTHRQPRMVAALLALAINSVLAAAPDLGVVSKRGNQSIARLQTGMASWTVAISLNTEMSIVADVFGTSQKRHIRSLLEANGRRKPLADLTMSESQWHVRERQGIHGRYRPYEAPFSLALLSVFVARVEPQFVIERDAGLGEHLKTTGTVATYRSKLPEEQERMLRSVLKQAEKLKEHGELSAKMKQTCREAKQLLTEGIETEVDVESGLMRKYGATRLQTRVSNFRWHRKVDRDRFRIPDSGEDHTSDPTEADMNEIVMISNLASWTPAMGKGGEPDGRLLDLKRDVLRRIPFVGMAVQGGCFLKGRKEVVAVGMPPEGGRFGLYIIDLSTGESRELQDAELGTGFFFGPCLSPDGQTIAVSFMKAVNITEPSIIVLFNVGSGKASILGKVIGGQNMAWYPDGKRLFMMREESVGMDKPSVKTICCMDMGGSIKDIREGSRAILLHDGRILFTKNGERSWHTCSGEGGDVRRFFGGMSEYGFPSRSPDGTRLLMMKFDKATGPRPTIVNLKNGTTKPATARGGLWAWPNWL